MAEGDRGVAQTGWQEGDLLEADSDAGLRREAARLAAAEAISPWLAQALVCDIDLRELSTAAGVGDGLVRLARAHATAAHDPVT